MQVVDGSIFLQRGRLSVSNPVVNKAWALGFAAQALGEIIPHFCAAKAFMQEYEAAIFFVSLYQGIKDCLIVGQLQRTQFSDSLFYQVL